MDATPHILVVDDEPDVREMVEEYLSSHGFMITTAADAADARVALNAKPFDLCLLDVTMPGEDGLSLARYVRATCHCGIIMLTAATSVVDRIVGLEIGADDYIAKPFDPRELLARVRSVLRRVVPPAGGLAAESQAPAPAPALQPPPQPVPAAAVAAPTRRSLPFGRCLLDIEARRLTTRAGEDVPITAMEFDLLRAFAERPGRVLTRDQLLDLAHNREWDPFDRSIDIRIARLRRKVEEDPSKPEAIKTVRGAGYMFVLPGKRGG